MALGSTRPLTDMSTRNTSRGYGWSVGRGDNFTTIMCCLEIWKPQPSGPVQACTGTAWHLLHTAECSFTRWQLLSWPKNVLPVVEPTGSLTHKQAPATELYSDLVDWSPYPHKLSSISILILSCNISACLPSSLFPSGIQLNFFKHFALPHTSYTSYPSFPPWLHHRILRIK
jgi:hypothetical protein